MSWSPKGKQFSAVMKNADTGSFTINQYDTTMAEKRSTVIGDVRSEFKGTFKSYIDWCVEFEFSADIMYGGLLGDVCDLRMRAYDALR